MFPAAAVGRSSSVIRVLSRSVVAPKQQFLLLQVGKRIIVVGDCGTSMNRLSEITDPDEVASLIGQIDAVKPESISRAFGQLFGNAREQFNAGEEQDTSDEPELELAGTGGASLMESSDGDPEVVSTRGELNGLMERVRMLSRQFRRT
jgi:hypothetical protein